MVTKNILLQYIDLKQEYKDLEEKIKKLEKNIETIENEKVIDKVKGGLGGIQHFRIEGIAKPEYDKKKALLYVRKSRLKSTEIKILESINEIEEFLDTIDDSHIRRIINYRVIDGLSWGKVAKKMGGGNTEDSVKKMFYRFLNEIQDEK